MNQLPTRAATRFQLDAKAKLPPLSAQLAAQFRPTADARPARPAVTTDARLSRKFAEGLQLTRASTIALTRLQLALAGGDRRQAMAAIDRLHAIDGEIEHLVEQLPPSVATQGAPGTGTLEGEQPHANDEPPANDDPMAVLGKHLADQKLALAFEKLALASGISGPDLVSPGLVDPAHPLAHAHSLAHDSDEPPLPYPASRHDAPPRDRADDPRHDRRNRAALDESEPPLVDWHAFPDVHTHVWDRIPAKLWGTALAVLVTLALAIAAMVMTTF